MSTILMMASILNPSDSKGLGISIDDILYFNKTYYEVKDYIEKEIEKE